MMKNLLASCVVLATCLLQCCAAEKINYPGCDRAGWKCIKLQVTPVKYLIEYVCQGTTSISLSLWNFRAPADIRDLRIVNCTSLEIDLSCTNEGRLIESLHIKNAGQLNFTNILYKDLAQLPKKVMLENIREMAVIPERTFKQMKAIPAATFRCAATVQPLEAVIFKNVNIDTIKENAFWNLTDIKKFTWTNVTVKKMEALALQVNLERGASMNISNCSFNELDYKSLTIRSPNINFIGNTFKDVPSHTLNATSFVFNFVNNTVDTMHPYAFSLLGQDITIEDNLFKSMRTTALQGIGPGLLENALVSFGELKFTYNFNNNTILMSDISGLNPDWIAYKNVRSFLNVTYNYLPCSCKELGWITVREGLGEKFSEMMSFNSKYLDKNNNNLCLNAPCKLPVSVMTGMSIRLGHCCTSLTLLGWCKKFNPKSNDLGFGQSAKLILQKWKKDFPPEEPQDTETCTDDVNVNNIETLYDIFSNIDDQKIIQFPTNDSHPTYFKIVKTNVENMNSRNSFMDTLDLNGLVETVTDNNRNISDNDVIYFMDEADPPNNRSGKYSIDIRSKFEPESASLVSNSTETQNSSAVLKFQNDQTNFLRDSYLQWQKARKKRMVYFKVYGNLMMLE